RQIPWEEEQLIGDFCFAGCGRFSAQTGSQDTPPTQIQTGQTLQREAKGFREPLKSGGYGPLMVRIPGADYAMGTYEISVGEYRRFEQNSGYRSKGDDCYVDKDQNGSWEQVSDASWQKPYFEQSAQHPVVCISWSDAVAYGKWLSRETGNHYRLPTSEEWERAARAETTTERYWGDDVDLACAYANVADQTGKQKYSHWTIHNCRDDHVYTAPVGQFRPNAWGLYDVLGNAWEWTCSLYDGEQSACAPEKGNESRVLRGGSWYNFPDRVRSAFRYLWRPTKRNDDVGFRVARIY
ncbi:formylglycine-generating enzyme family protein, partial [Candidatus Venteria ishoeyi]